MPAEYRNRNDAKVAVVQLAFEQGAIEFLRFNGEPPPEGYKVELPPPRESKKAKRKATDVTENEDGNSKKKPKLLSQAVQFLAAAGRPKPAFGSAATANSFNAPSSAVPMFLPRRGYVDSKPEPGELPDEPPVIVAPRWPAVPVPFQRTRELPPLRRPTTEPPLHYTRNEYEYGVREHGHQYGLGVGDTRYDDPGAYAPDPYYAPPPPPAPHTEPWHARSFPPEDGDEYRRSTYYGDRDYAPPPPPLPGYDYDYGRHSRYTPPLPPEPAQHGYDDDLGRRSGYDDSDHAYSEYAYAHKPPAPRRIQPRSPPPQLSPPPPSSPPPDLTAPIPKPRRRAPHPPPGPPRVWEPGPHAAKLDGPTPPAPMSAVAFSRGGTETTVMSAPLPVPAVSSSSSSSSTPGSSSAHRLHSKAPTPASEPPTSTHTPSSSKEELIGMFSPSTLQV